MRGGEIVPAVVSVSVFGMQVCQHGGRFAPIHGFV